MRLIKLSLIPALFLFLSPILGDSLLELSEPKTFLAESSQEEKEKTPPHKEDKEGEKAQKHEKKRPSSAHEKEKEEKEKEKPHLNKEGEEGKGTDLESSSNDQLTAATESYEGAFFKTILVLVGLLVLVVLTIWMFKKISSGRFRSFNYMKTIKVIEKRPLSPKSMLYLIEVAGKQILISESQLDVRTLSTLDYLGEKDL